MTGLHAALAWAFFKVGLFAYGGGYASIPLIISEVVKSHGWITEKEFLLILTASEMTPGATAIKAATFVGYRIAGLPGALLATSSVILPSLLLVSAVFHLYHRMRDLPQVQSMMLILRPAVLAILASTVLTLAGTALSGWTAAAIFAAAFAAYLIFKPHPVVVIVAAGLAGLLAGLL